MNFLKAIFITCALILLCFPSQGCRKGEESALSLQSTKPLRERLYTDPKGYFEILIPLDWEARDFPNDPRGKALFVGGHPNTNLRVIAKPTRMRTFDELKAAVKEIEKKFMRSMNIQEIQIGKGPALMRDVVVGEVRVLMVDILRDGIWHNLRYETKVESFTVYLPAIMECVTTYITLSPTKPDSQSMTHAAWSAYFLAEKALREHDTLSARFFVDKGLSFDPGNESLIELSRTLGKEPEG